MSSPAADGNNSGSTLTASNLGAGSLPVHSGRSGTQINFHTASGAIHYTENHYDDRPKKQTSATFMQWLNTQAAPFHEAHVHRLQTMLEQERVAGTGTWATDDEKFRDWKSLDDHRLLWVHGISISNTLAEVGSGKSMIVSLIISHLRKRIEMDSKNEVCIFFYFQNEEESQPTHAQFLACLLAQLLRGLLERDKGSQIIDRVRSIHDQYQASNHGNTPSVIEWIELICAQSAKVERVYLVIDALDNHASSTKTEASMLETIRKLPRHFKILLTTRSSATVGNTLRASREQELVVRAHRSDLEEYVEYRIAQDENLQRFVQQGQVEDPEFKKRMIDEIRFGSQEIFLVAALHVNELRKQPSLGEFRAALAKPPADLSNVFAAAINRIKCRPSQSDRAFAVHTLTWVVYATRPMSADEIIHSFSITKTARASDRQFDRRSEDLMSVCEGLAVVNSGNRVVRLVHDSVRDLLQKAGLLSHNSDATMMQQCLKYLLSDDFSEVASCKDEVESRCRDFPFLEYAAHNWTAILGQARTEGIADVEEDVFTLLRHNEKVTSWFQAVSKDAVAKITGLHAAVYFDSPTWAKKLIERGMDVNSRCSNGQTAVHWAARQGHMSFVQLFLCKTDPARLDVQDVNGNTPLHMAFLAKGLYGHPDYQTVITQLVLSNAAQMNVRNKVGIAPFEQAMKDGPDWARELLAKHQPIKALVDSDNERSPLWQAMQFVRPHFMAHIVYLLLEGGADVRQGRRCLWHPLIAVCQTGDEKIVYLLLRYQAPPNVEDNEGNTPLRASIQYGYPRVSQLLLSYGADVSHPYRDGKTPLIAATISSPARSIIAWQLLEKGASIDDQDETGSTALHYAVFKHDVSLIWLLATRGASSIIRNKTGHSVLDLVASKGDYSVFWILLDQESRSNKSRFRDEASTALFCAAREGHRHVAELILSKGININATDAQGLSALAHAACQKQQRMIKCLLREGASMDIQDRTGATALHHAIRLDDGVNISQILLQEGANPNIPDHEGKTALMLARELGKGKEVNLLLHSRAGINT